ncbi:hypothetical protein [Lysobacter fragariae]
MKRKLMTTLLLALVAGAASGAASAGTPPGASLARAVGITEHEVRALMGWSPLTYYEFRQDHSRTAAKIIRKLGQERYDALMAGKPVLIEGEENGRRVAYEVQLER